MNTNGPTSPQKWALHFNLLLRPWRRKRELETALSWEQSHTHTCPLLPIAFSDQPPLMVREGMLCAQDCSELPCTPCHPFHVPSFLDATLSPLGKPAARAPLPFLTFVNGTNLSAKKVGSRGRGIILEKLHPSGRDSFTMHSNMQKTLRS